MRSSCFDSALSDCHGLFLLCVNTAAYSFHRIGVQIFIIQKAILLNVFVGLIPICFFSDVQITDQLESPQLRRYSPLLESALLPIKDVVSGEWKAVPDIWKSVAEKYGDKVALVDPYHDPPSMMTYKEVHCSTIILPL